MKYPLLVRGDEAADASGTVPVEPWVQELGGSGARLPGHRLALPSEAVTVRVRGGDLLRVTTGHRNAGPRRLSVHEHVSAPHGTTPQHTEEPS